MKLKNVYKVILIPTILCGPFLIHANLKAATDYPDIFLNEFIPNPDGSDEGKEWIELYNLSGEADLTGWTIRIISDAGSTRNTVLPETLVASESFFIITEDESLFPESNKVVVGSGKLSMYNSPSKVQLIDKDGNIKDEIHYSTPTSGKSFERPGPLNLDTCKILGTHPSTDTIGIQNSNYDALCWPEEIPPEEVFISNITFSIDQINWTDTINNYDKTLLYLDYELSEEITNVISEKWFLDDNTEITNPFLFENYKNRSVKLKLTFDTETTIEATSNPISIFPKLTVQISEVYPSPDTSYGETEWLELYNYGNIELDLTNSYLKDASGQIHKFEDITIAPKKHLVIESPKTSLNNSGDIIDLFTPTDYLIDSFTYSSISKQQVAARNFGSEMYESNYVASDNPNNYVPISTISTPGNFNQFPSQDISSDTQNEAEDLVNKTPINVSDAKQKTGEKVVIQGYSIVEKDILGENIIYITDLITGIKIVLPDDTTSDFPTGRQIKLFGKVLTNSNETYLKVEKQQDILEITGSDIIISPKKLSINQLSDDFLGTLVSVEGIIAKNYSTSFDIGESINAVRISVLKTTNIDILEKEKGDTAIVTGILIKAGNIFKILPRYQDDLTIQISEIPTEVIEEKKEVPKVAGVSTSVSQKANPVRKISYKLPSLQLIKLPIKVDHTTDNKTTIYPWPIFLAMWGLLIVYLLFQSDKVKSLSKLILAKLTDKRKEEVYVKNRFIERKLGDS